MITSPDDPALAQLCTALRERSASLEVDGAWPGEQLGLCARAGVFTWFVPREQGGQGWSEAAIVRGYLELSAACLTTTFVITQFMGAVSRLSAAGNETLQALWLSDLLAGRRFATVALSHLTTSRRHLAAPVMRAQERPGGFVLDGYSPWVTGAARADLVVLGATLADGRQILVALPTNAAGVTIPPPERLVALSASQTGELRCEQAFVTKEWLLAGPVENVMQQGLGAKTGGLQTSTLAVGLAGAALAFLEREAGPRTSLVPPTAALRDEWSRLRGDLLSLASSPLAPREEAPPLAEREGYSAESIRTRANSLALRSTQAALAAAKGTGFVIGHPAGRWCREALFFLVWSCPQGVTNANLCELAGL